MQCRGKKVHYYVIKLPRVLAQVYVRDQYPI